jgi:hypothetical protein
MTAGRIIWKTTKALARQRWAPIDAETPEPPDHQPRFVLRDGVPALCCDQHFHPRADG